MSDGSGPIPENRLNGIPFDDDEPDVMMGIPDMEISPEKPRMTLAENGRPSLRIDQMQAGDQFKYLFEGVRPGPVLLSCVKLPAGMRDASGEEKAAMVLSPTVLKGRLLGLQNERGEFEMI